MKNRLLSRDTQFCVSETLYEQAVRCYWADKCEFRLWMGFGSFNALPQFVRELYFEEARVLLRDLAN